MGLFTRHRWFVLAGGFTLAFAVVSLAVRRGPVLNAISNVSYLLLIVVIAAGMLANARATQGANRRFWALMGSGCVLWASHQFAYSYYEVLRQATLPDPWFMDVVLFLHPIPMIAAVGLHRYQTEDGQKFRIGTLDFLQLLAWWVFLYAFIVFPSQYVSVNVPVYDWNYNVLYMVDCAVMVLVLGIAARGAASGMEDGVPESDGGERPVLGGLGRASTWPLTHGEYYSGSLYDVPLIGAVSWMAATALTAGQATAHQRSIPPGVEMGQPHGAAAGHAGHTLTCRCWGCGPCCGINPPPPPGPSAFSRCWLRCCCWARSCSCGSIFRTRR